MAAPGFPVQVSSSNGGVDGTVTTREQVSEVDMPDYKIIGLNEPWTDIVWVPDPMQTRPNN